MSTATPPIPAWLFRALERLGEPSRGGPRRAGLGGQVTAAAMLLLFALPGSLVGIAMIRFWNRDAAPRCFHALYDSGLMLPLGLAAVHLPLAWLLLHGRLRATPAVLGEVERLQPLAPGRRWLELSAPRLAVAGALAAGLVFVLALSEVHASILLAAPGQETLAIRSLTLLHYAPDRLVAAFCLVQLATTAAGLALLAAASVAGLKLWRRLAPHHAVD